VAAASILTEMRGLGFTDDQTRDCLKRLALKRLIETPHAHYREIKVPDGELPDEFHFRATSVGLYHIKFWAGAFDFIDATSIDTPIFDNKVREIVVKHASSWDIRDRFAKSKAFRSYLENQWHLGNFSPSYFDFVQVLKSNDFGFASVNTFIQRQYS
jgi:hypothetical protein